MSTTQYESRRGCIMYNWGEKLQVYTTTRPLAAGGHTTWSGLYGRPVLYVADFLLSV